VENEELTNRESRIRERVDEALHEVHRIIFDNHLTLRESRLAWTLLMAKMLDSISMEHQTEATKEWLGLTKGK
jgi:hypothetical protein